MISVILAGGSGTRLFPLSRKNFPKQFLKIHDTESLFQKTIKRVLNVTEPENVVIVTNKDYQFHVKNQLSELSFPNSHLIFEPTRKNTAPAIALACKFAVEKLKVPEDEVIFVTPSDHIISPEDKFIQCLLKSEKTAKGGYIVTFGIKPTKPEVGYGYIQVRQSDNYKSGILEIESFKEKPDQEMAKRYLEENSKSLKYYWNSGMFVFSIDTLMNELKKYTPEIFELINGQSFEEVMNNFDKMPEISIDYAIMEKTDRVCVFPVDINWSDVGSWDSVYEVMGKDENKNVKIGDVVDIDTKNSLILGEKGVIATVGVENLMVIETDDILLIAKKGQGQRVRDVVDKLNQNRKHKYITEFHTTVYRPWGSYTELEKGSRYKIKRITVKPGGALSLQLHYHRSEHWVVVKGTAKVILEDKNGQLKEFYLHENESTYVPKTTKHRLINEGKIPLEIIEIQVGEYIGEDDIVRFEDVYNRTD